MAQKRMYSPNDSLSESKAKYVKSIDRIIELDDNIKKLYMQLENYINEFPYELRALPVKDRKLNIQDLSSRTPEDRKTILKAILLEINKSDNFRSEEEKNQIKEELKNIFKSIEKKEREKAKEVSNLRSIEKHVTNIKMHVRNLNLDNRGTINHKEKLVNYKMQQIEYYQKNILDKNEIPESIKEPTRDEIEKIQEEIRTLQEEIEQLKETDIRYGSNLTEEEAREIISEQLQSQNMSELRSSIVLGREVNDVFEERKQLRNGTSTTPKQSNTNVSSPKKVVEQHSASPSLVEKIKKNVGKLFLGIGKIGASVANAIMNSEWLWDKNKNQNTNTNGKTR